MNHDHTALRTSLRHTAGMGDRADEPPPGFSGDGSTADLKTYFRVLIENRWLIVGVALLVTLAGALYAASRPPVYETTLSIRVEEPSPNATRNVLSDVSSLFETKKTTMAEMELLQSRKVILPAVEKLGLDVVAVPKRFPLPGLAHLFADRNGGLSKPGLFGRGGYVWGDEDIHVQVFRVPPALLNRSFELTALGDGRYSVDDGIHPAWLGMVGRKTVATTAAGTVELLVDRLDGKPGAHFLLSRLPMPALVAAIQGAMTVTELGKQSGMIEVKLQGDDPVKASDLLNEIGRQYAYQNLAHNTEQAEKSLAILDERLPLLKRELERSEAAYNNFRQRNSTVNLSEEGRLGLQQSAAAEAKRFELLQKRSELQTRLSDQHPAMQAIDEQLAAVNREIGKSAGTIRSLPRLEQEELGLSRDIKVNTDLYAQLSNTAQQLRILAASKLNNVQLIDGAAVPDTPVKPNRPVIISAAVILGLLLGTSAAFVRRSLRTGVDSAKTIEQSLRAKVVLANIPHSSYQKRLTRQSGARLGSIPLLAQVAPGDPAIEALRTFRAALQFMMPQLKNNIVMITGPTSHLGKSFVAANTAAVIAASGKRVLLVDMDMRNGHLHRYFGTTQEDGLYEAITSMTGAGQGIRHEVLLNLDFIPTGKGAIGRHEFLTQRDVGIWLRTASAHYDVILIDAPPVLAVADAAIIGAHAGAVFIVARAGVTTEEEIGESVGRLNHAGISPEGIIFNDGKLRHRASEYMYNYVPPKQIGWGT
jgi:tyrosine-protein kinase Etk/Wzc